MLSFLKFGASHHDGQSVTALRKQLLAAEAMRAQSEDAFVEALRSIEWKFNPTINDPFSEEYKHFWYEQYETLSDRVYELNNEDFEFDVASHIEDPFPYCVKSPVTVANQLVMWAGAIKALQGIDTGASIVELGTGWGNLALQIAQIGYDVTCVDINSRYQQLVEARASQLQCEINFRVGEFSAGLKESDQWDAIIFFESFHHSRDPAALLDLCKKALKPEGRIIFAGEPIIDQLPYAWGLNPNGEALWQIYQHGWFELVFRKDFFLELLKRHNFVVEVMSDGLTAPCYVASK